MLSDQLPQSLAYEAIVDDLDGTQLKKVTSSTAGIAQWLGPLGIGCPFFSQMSSFSLETRKKTRHDQLYPQLRHHLYPVLGPRHVFFQGSSPVEDQNAAGAGRG